MVFNSSFFLCYFLPLFLLVNYLLPAKLRNYWILGCSLAFMAWASVDFFLVALLSVMVTFVLTALMHKSSGQKRLLLMGTAVALNLGLLLYYKYTGFFVENFNLALSGLGLQNLSWTSVALHLGISFNTYHQLSYVTDVYREEKPPLSNPFNYALYVLMFPRLMAGPILRYADTADAIAGRRADDTVSGRLAGIFRFSVGLAKKVLIADVLGNKAAEIFALQAESLSSPMAWMGLLVFSLQIYVDFSAYSDMAIGLGRTMGFRFPENFNSPYLAGSITEFWRRWHISLYSFLKEYVYMPLAVKWRGSGKAGLFLALMITFTLCGMWHDAGWTFILWGMLQGVLLILDQLFMLKFLRKITRIPAMLLTFFAVMMGWVLFLSSDTSQALAIYTQLFSGDFHRQGISFNPKFYTALGIALLFSVIGFHRKTENWQTRIFEPATGTGPALLQFSLTLILLLISISVIVSYGFSPFIYARF